MKLNYPTGKKRFVKQTSYSNLGMTLEKDLDETNRYYLNNNIAVIHKKPTPVQVVDVSYPSRNKAKIVEAYYKTPSTTDYNGLYKGYYIDFDAKETNSRTSIPLANIHIHQLEHLKQVHEHGGIAFLIVNWKQYNEYYYTPVEMIIESFKNIDKRKSIPYKTFQEKAYLIEFGYAPRLNYLKIVDQIISEKESSKNE